MIYPFWDIPVDFHMIIKINSPFLALNLCPCIDGLLIIIKHNDVNSLFFRILLLHFNDLFLFFL